MSSQSMLTTVEGRVSTKQLRREQLNKNSTKIAPKSYVENSDFEKKHLEVIQDKTKRILNDNPNIDPRCISMVSSENEYGVKKCVCATIKPELLPNPRMHSVDDYSQFIAQNFEYEPLERSFELPSYLASPTQVMTWGVGDAFDLAVLLASFLTGRGFDAHVAYGTAPRWICERDTSRNPLDRGQIKLEVPTFKEGYLDSDQDIRSMKMELRELALDCDDPSTLCWDLPDLEENQVVEEVGGRENGWLHCFVLMQNKGKGENSSILIEPSTGVHYLYGTVEIDLFAVWNSENYWIRTCKGKEKKIVNLESDEWVPLFENSNKLYSQPDSWVEKICIPQQYYESAYPPHGQRSSRLLRAKVEMYAEGIHDNDLIHRSTTYQDEKMVKVVDCLEYFGQNRQDNMTRRLRLPLEMCSREDYSPQNSHFLKTWIDVMGLKRHIAFYSLARSDGLSGYKETFGIQIQHIYSNRRDGLLNREIFVKKVDGLKEKMRKDRLILSTTDGAQNLVVTKIM